ELNVFLKLLKTDSSQENIYFWIACEDYRKSKTAHEIFSKVTTVYETCRQKDIQKKYSKNILQDTVFDARASDGVWFYEVLSLDSDAYEMSNDLEKVNRKDRELVMGGYGGASVRRDLRLPVCQTEPVPAGPKMDSPQDTPEPIRDDGGASVITYLRNGKNTVQQL
ncbi:PREDICTED: regulator of G-protein signaling 18-like, partial [Fulmarus glacialis]|uniref:regulator of G-protein signaling 18-like n=1 Tax=Fulmarus glacialis TaxID=30455 RepID=UPI00051BB99E